VLLEILEERGLELNRENRQKLGLEINETGRQRELAERTLNRAGDATKIVIDGLRFPDDHAFLYEKFGFKYFHMFVDADEKTREARYIERLNVSDKIARSEFLVAASSSVEAKVQDMGLLANEVCYNKGLKSDLVASVLQTTKEIYGEH